MSTFYLDALENARPGDGLGFAGPDCIAASIRCCAGGPINHIAVIGPHLKMPSCVVVYESTATIKRPCLYKKEIFKGVQAHPLTWRVKFELGRGGKVWLFPLTKPLDPAEVLDLEIACRKMLGTPYDYWGAWLARRWGFRWLTRRFYPSVIEHSKLYCSEFVEVAWDACNRFRRFSKGALAPSRLRKAQLEDGVFLDPIKLTL